MALLTQKTINEKITFKGVGLHTGKSVELTLIPSNANTGIIFRRTDLIKNNIIIPAYNNVVDTTLCTTLSNNHGAKVSTIEHLMGALYGLGIDNLIVEVNSKNLLLKKDFFDIYN